jgi:hypothetical protein
LIGKGSTATHFKKEIKQNIQEQHNEGQILNAENL